jgi:hypothetical protein
MLSAVTLKPNDYELLTERLYLIARNEISSSDDLSLMLIRVLTNLAGKQSSSLIVFKYLALDMSTRAFDTSELETFYTVVPIVQFSLFNSTTPSNRATYQKIIYESVHSSLAQFQELLESSRGLYEPTKLLKMINRQLDIIMLIIKYLLGSVARADEAVLPLMLLNKLYKFLGYFFQSVCTN